MKRILSVVPWFVVLALAVPLRAVDVWFSASPSGIASGTGYYVEASSYSNGDWGWQGWSELSLYKSGGYVASNGGYGFLSAGTWQSDSGPQTIEYFAASWDSGTGEMGYAWHYATINPPTNQAPFGVCDYAQSTVSRGATLSGSGWAADNEMGAAVSRVDVLVDGQDVGDAALGGDRQDVASYFGRADFRFSGWSFSLNTGALSLGTHTLTLRAWDNQGAWADFGQCTFTVNAAAPSITLLAPGAQTIAYGTTLTITSRATDADGNIVTHNLDIQRPGGEWNWSGSFAAGEPFLGGPVGSAADSTRTAAFTFNRVGTWYVRSWVNDAQGNSQHSATVAISVVDNLAPSKPTGLTAPSIDARSFVLQWSPSTDNVGIAGYDVVMDAGTPFGATTNYCSFVALNPATTFTVKVRARDGAGNVSAWSDALQVTTLSTVIPPPTLTAASVGSSFVTLSWSPGRVESGVPRYLVFRDGVQLTTAPIEQTSFTDWGRSPRASHIYRVVTVNDAGLQSAAATLTATTAAATLEVFTPLAL